MRSTYNLKHHCILALLHELPLSTTDLVALRLTDLPTLSQSTSSFLSNLLINYLRVYRPDYWLFPGPGGRPYTTRSVQLIFRRALHRAALPPTTIRAWQKHNGPALLP